MLRQHRLVVDGVGVPHLQIQLPANFGQQNRLHVRNHLQGQAVDIRQLIAGLIHLPEIRVAPQQHLRGAAAIRGLQHPRVHHRLFRVAPAGRNFNIAAFLPEQCRPVRLLGRRQQLGQVGVIFRHELRTVMLGIQRRVLAQRRRQHVGQPQIGRGENQLHRRIVDLLRPHRLAAHHVLARRRFEKRLVGEQIVDHEGDVIGGERHPVRPFGAGAQLEGVFGGVGIHRPACRQRRHRLGVGRVPTGQPLVADQPQNGVMVAIAADRRPQRPAIPADAGHLHYLRRARQALGNRRQLTTFHQLGHCRGLVILRRAGQSGAPDRHRQHR